MSLRVKAWTPTANWPPETQRKQQKNGSRTLGRGGKQEVNGRNKEETEEQRKGGTKGEREQRKDKRNKDGKREMQITVEAEEECILFEKT